MKAVRDGTRAFEGLSFYVTPSFVLGADTTKQMVESAGGYMLDALPSKNEEGFDNIKLVVLGNEDDMALCKKIAKSYNIDIHTKEFVLTGLLKQSADFER